LAFVMIAGRKRAASLTGVGFGVLVSASRVAAGAHFLSDAVVSFFVMLIVADFLHYCMFQPEPERLEPAPAAEPGVLVGAAGKSLP
jgi:membrane-associated PAP2 superfamily phosphatase